MNETRWIAGALILSLFLSLATAGAARAQGAGPPPGDHKRWAVVVGGDDYAAPGLPRLEGATRDADELRKALVAHGRFPADQVVVLSKKGGPDLQPTRNNVLTKLSEVLEKVEPDGLFLFFFSGHGMFLASTSFLLTTNVTGTTYGALNSQAIKADELRELIYGSKAKEVVFLIDACRSDQAAVVDHAQRSFASAFPLPENIDFAVIHSTAQRHLSYESRRPPKMGYFTREVVRALQGAAGVGSEKRERDLTLTDMVEQLQRTVPAALLQDGRAGTTQLPQAKYAQRGAQIVLGYRDAQAATVTALTPAEGWLQLTPPAGALSLLSHDRLKVTVDGREVPRQQVRNAIPMSPGRHQVVATLDRQKLFDDRVEVQSGLSTPVELDRPYEGGVSPWPRWIWTGALGVVAASAVTTALVYRGKANDRERGIENACASGCDWPKVSNLDREGRRFDLIHGLMIATAAAAAAGGVAVWFLVGRPPATGEPRASAASGGLAWSTRF